MVKTIEKILIQGLAVFVGGVFAAFCIAVLVFYTLTRLAVALQPGLTFPFF